MSPPHQEDPLICAPHIIRGHGGVALGRHRRVNHSTPLISFIFRESLDQLASSPSQYNNPGGSGLQLISQAPLAHGPLPIYNTHQQSEMNSSSGPCPESRSCKSHYPSWVRARRPHSQDNPLRMTYKSAILLIPTSIPGDYSFLFRTHHLPQYPSSHCPQLIDSTYSLRQ
ncbi:hypothetical protein GBAR_LOCUS789 [Geodia barretti]|uniref:Uncharacterized protein n=1 Tax=Geodia barretti TaxID=519541 RepID=A0AA35QU96_GEOBA|nr:hypothetical protein GBAR_LOCUS789 [Geodia barretti]